MSYNIPILLTVFNRIECTQEVFYQIRKIKPNVLFIASDGYRKNKQGEKNKVDYIRSWILDSIDRKCEVKTLLRDQNLGCKRAMIENISWFFSHVEYGIILEDDCLPSKSFFYFIKKMLLKYKDNDNIMHIAGFNPLGNRRDNDLDYIYSSFTPIRGWATWRRSWILYDEEIAMWKNKKYKKIISKIIGKHFSNSLDDIIRGVDTWDSQRLYSVIARNGLSIIPTKNMIKNIGFTDDSTHTFVDIGISKIPIYEMSEYIRMNNLYVIDKEFDEKFIKKYGLSIMKKIYYALTDPIGVYRLIKNFFRKNGERKL